MLQRLLAALFRLWIVVLLIIILSGCWSRRELDESYVVLAFGIDRVEEQYEVTVQAVDPYQMSQQRAMSGRTPVTAFSMRAPTVLEALRKMTTTSSRRMYAGHLLMVIFDEATAKEGLQPAMDLLLRENEIRPDFTLAVIRNYRARDVLEIFTPTEILPALDLHKSLYTSERVWAPTSATLFLEFIAAMAKDGRDPVITGLQLEGDVKKAKSMQNLEHIRPMGQFKYTGIGVFRGDRLVGWLNKDDSRAYSYINNHIYTSVISMPCPRMDDDDEDEYFLVEITRSKVNQIPSIVDDHPHMKLEVNAESNIAEFACTHINLTDEQDFMELQHVVTDKMEQIFTNGINTAKEKYGADIFGFGESIHRKYPEIWAEWKKDWTEQFKRLTFELEMNVHLNRFGKFANPYKLDSEKE